MSNPAIESAPVLLPQRSAQNSTLRYIGFCLLAGAIYICVAKLSLFLAFKQANTSAVWPCSGLAIGTLVVFGRRYWPAVTIGVLVVTLLLEDTVPRAALAMALGNTLEAVVGATLINRFADGRNCLRGAPTVFRFIVLAAMLSPLLSAGIGVTSLVLWDDRVTSDYFGEIFFTWYTGNVAGVLVFAPMMILWSIPRRRWTREERLEGIVLLGVLVLVGQAICGIFLTGIFEQWPSAYMVIPVLLWAAFRLGRRGAVAALIVLMAIAVAGTVRGFEVFPGPTPNLSLLYLQIFLSVVSMMTLVVAGLVSELHLANESLEQKVRSRTRRLEEMVKEKDDLMAIAAHDLQAPLAGMRNLLQLVGSRPESLSTEGGGRVLSEMERTTDDMLNLVSSLLVAKRAEELDKALTLATCDIVELLRRMIETQQSLAEGKGIEIVLQAPDHYEVSTHPESFSQIAANLVSNAVKYSPPDGKVEVGLAEIGGGKFYRLEVRDRGAGVPASEVESIFEKFHRAENQPTGGEPSHGIGLYIVATLSRALGGEVAYSGNPGGGSCFTVTLPVRGAGSA